MFEGLRFMTFNNKWLSEQNISTTMMPRDQSPDKEAFLRNAIREQSPFKFTFDGEVRLLLPYPISEEARTYYYCPQVFALCQCGEAYYTLRSGFESYEILYTYEGAGVLEYEGKIYHLGPGDGFFIDCRRNHHYYTDGDHWLHSDFHFDGPQAEYHFAEFFSKGDPTFHDAQEGQYQRLLEKSLQIWDSVLTYKHLQESNSISDIIAYLLIKKSGSFSNNSAPEVISRLIKYIELHFSEQLTLDQLSEMASLSKYHLSREFKKYAGMSPINYLIFARIENAKIIMTHTDLPLYSVAQQVGFNDINNFTNQFRKYTGMTPKQFRKGQSSPVPHFKQKGL